MVRYIIGVVVGAIITFCLFYVMQLLIANNDNVLEEAKGGRITDFVRLQEDEDVQTKQRKPKKPPPPDEPPPDVPPQNFNVAVDNAGFSMANVDMNVNVDVSGGGFGITDGEYLPIVKVQPQYPRRALSRGMTGWVIVEFTVTEQGAVRDPVVIANCGWIQSARREGECEDSPNGVFDTAAMRAAEKFKYKPKVIDGTPVETAGVQNKLSFELLNE